MKLNTLLIKLAMVGILSILAIGCGSSSSDSEVVDNANQPTGNVPIAPAGVYTMTNDVAANAVREFRRNTNGSLSFVADYPTGGSGSGDTLDGSSNGIIFVANSNRFYVVNAGSNSISAMVLGADGSLSTVSTSNSGGVRPISVTAFNDIVYVLNAGDAGTNQPANITGFRQNGNQLLPLAGSTQALSAANPNPAQIQFTPSGTVLVVTERATNQITTFTLGGGEIANPGLPQPSAGTTPFGFDFTAPGILVVSEANGGNAGGSSASSYQVGVDGTITNISSAVTNNQTGACWVEVARNFPFAYTANTGSNSISIFGVNGSGVLTLQGDGNNAATGAGPIDLDISDDSAYLYVLNRDDDSISAYSINPADGTLTGITGIAGLPANSVGLVAR